jgi:uncharacterized protein YjbI with pentapeptide repeats
MRDYSFQDLQGSNLQDAYLQGANLQDAYLEGTNLRGAYLEGVTLPIFCKWPLLFTLDGFISIGCQRKTIQEWDKWFEGNEVFNTYRGTSEFALIQAAYEAHKIFYFYAKNFIGK